MRAVERKSMWHHTAFSLVLCAVLIGIVWVRRDTPGVLLAALVAAYIAGNTFIHFVHKDFRKETLLEYILVGSAVLIVLLGAVRH
jgi:hypothetical protein